MVLNEEFNTTKQDVETRWSFTPDTYGWGWGFEDGEYYDANQVSINANNNGKLVLTASLMPVDNLGIPTTEIIASRSKFGLRNPHFKSGMINLRKGITGSTGLAIPNTTPTQYYQFDEPTCEGSNRGFKYGIIEASVKMPSSDAFPAFWMWGNGDTQINIFEGVGDTKAGSQIRKTQSSFNDESYSNAYGQHGAAYVNENHFGWGDLSQSFHTYSVVWQRDVITFFFDGTEIFTARNWHPKKQDATGNWIDITNPNNNNQPYNFPHDLRNRDALNILIDLQMNGYNPSATTMEVDWIRIWKANNDVNNDGYVDNTNPPNSQSTLYKSSNEFIYHELEIAPPKDERPLLDGVVLGNVDKAYGSIAINPNNTNEVFYKRKEGDYYRIYLKNLSNPTASEVLIDYPYPFTLDEQFKCQAIGELKYKAINYGILYYVGGDNRIQYFDRHADGTWGHWWVDDNWGNYTYWMNTNFQAAIGGGSFDVADNGDVYYKSLTEHLCWFKKQTTADLYGMPVDRTPYNISIYNYVVGDLSIVTVATNNYKVNYRTTNSNIYSATGIGSVATSLPYKTPSTMKQVLTKAGSIVNRPTETYFIEPISHRIYSLNTNLPIYSENHVTNPNWKAELVNGNLVWGGNNWIYYVGYDGRIQMVYIDGSTWVHWWADNRWASNYFMTYNNTTLNIPSGIDELSDIQSSSMIWNGNKVIYTRKHLDPSSNTVVPRIGYFMFESCEILNPYPINNEDIADLWLGRFANPLEDAIPQLVDTDIYLFPNPTNGSVTIKLISNDTNIGDIEIDIYDIYGNFIYHKIVEKNEDSVVLPTQTLSIGTYFILYKSPSRVISKKLIKF